MAYEERTYRKQMKSEDLEYFQVLEFESDLFIGIDGKANQPLLSQLVLKEVQQLRKAIFDYNITHPNFIESLIPLKSDRLAVPIVTDMLAAGIMTGVGPMAAVAGAVSKYVGKRLKPYSKEIIVENGGDLLIKTSKTRRIAIHTGNSQFQDLSLKINPREKALGICTSSGVMGHSLSFGKADAVTVLSENIPLADATATALCNRIKKPEDVAKGIEWVNKIPGILGVLILIEDQLGAWGEIELC
ncbi:UPF0280 family protein [Acetobacterium tundrae]|uniref:UPF0280 family protein n=1 Tax=Acetobacterium tundrae TaxID=132932 RepID=A0ABR6WKX3_9FIRM|nr:UPF0280 family protein [Acetobacterium tundrae]MBC3797135.1 UPF0280 family protein [Acetobacterium tundrae]